MAKWRATEVFTDAGLKIVAIESVTMSHGTSSNRCGFLASIVTKAVVVLAEDDTYAVDLKAGKMTLGQLRRELPALDEIIAPFGSVN